MGFLDNLLKDIANGNIDKKLEQIADTVEKFSGKMDDTAKKAVTTSETAIKKVDQAGHRAVDTVKSIDDITKRPK